MDATVRVLLGDRLGHFGAPENLVVSEGIVHLATGDFNGDGQADIVLSKPGGVVDVRLRDGSTWAPSQEIVVEDRELYPSHVGNPVVVADVNGDRASDIVAGIRFGPNADSLVALLGDGNGGFAATAMFQSSRLFSSLCARDLNADGKDDIVAIDTQDFGIVTVWMSER